MPLPPQNPANPTDDLSPTCPSSLPEFPILRPSNLPRTLPCSRRRRADPLLAKAGLPSVLPIPPPPTPCPLWTLNLPPLRLLALSTPPASLLKASLLPPPPSTNTFLQRTASPSSPPTTHSRLLPVASTPPLHSHGLLTQPDDNCDHSHGPGPPPPAPEGWHFHSPEKHLLDAFLFSGKPP